MNFFAQILPPCFWRRDFEGLRNRQMGERRNGRREGREGGGGGRGCGLSSLMKQKIKGKNCAVFCFAGKRFFFLYLWCDYMEEKKKKALLITTHNIQKHIPYVCAHIHKIDHVCVCWCDNHHIFAPPTPPVSPTTRQDTHNTVYVSHGSIVLDVSHGSTVQYVSHGSSVQYVSQGSTVQSVSHGSTVQYVSHGSSVQYVSHGSTVQYVSNSSTWRTNQILESSGVVEIP